MIFETWRNHSTLEFDEIWEIFYKGYEDIQRK
jgi:hypothetical protein